MRGGAGVFLAVSNSLCSSASTARVRRGKPEGSSSSIRSRLSARLARTASAADHTAASGFSARTLADEFHNFLGRGPGKKNFRDAGLLERGDVSLGDDAADEHGDVLHAFLPQ